MRTFILTLMLASAMVLSAAAPAQIVNLYGTGSGPGSEAFITQRGVGFGGADVSQVEPQYQNPGYNCNAFLPPPNGPSRLAEDFVVPPGSVWMLDSATLYGYQSNSGPVPSINGAYVAILADIGGQPGPVIFGDFVTNRFLGASFTNVYRVESTLLNALRPIMEVRADMSWAPLLPPGRYWLAYSMSGPLPNGPSAPPVTPAEPNHNGWQFRDGMWSRLDGNNEGPGLLPQSTTVILRGEIVFNQPPLPPVRCQGDTNGDDTINFPDLNTNLSFFGQTVPPYANGDVDGDGDVDFADLNIILSTFGTTCPPVCSNCHFVLDIIYECFHWLGEDTGAPCRTGYCISNFLDTASCDYFPSGTGRSRCDTAPDSGPKITQDIIRRDTPGSCPAGIEWHPWEPSRTYYGCDDECWRKPAEDGVWKTSCETAPCSGTFVGDSDERGERKKCGC